MSDTPTSSSTSSRRKGAKLKEVVRVHHTQGGGHTDFDNENDALDFINEAVAVKEKSNPDGSREKVFSPNAHLFYGAKHPDYPNVRVEKFHHVEFPEDDE